MLLKFICGNLNIMLNMKKFNFLNNYVLNDKNNILEIL